MTQFAWASKVAATAFVAALFAAADAVAADAPTMAPAVQGVLNCKTIADPTQRLACYDAAVARMGEAQANGDLVTIDRDQRRAVRRQAFGFSLPALSMFDKGEKPEEADRITETVAGVSRDGKGKWVVKLETGAVWRQIDGEELLNAPHDGSTAVIRKGAIGSFFMKIDGQPQIRVHRDS